MSKVTNEDLLVEIEKSKANGMVTDTLGRMFVWIADKRVNNPIMQNYPLMDEMKEEAIIQMCKQYTNFDTSKYDKPFAYLYTIAGCACTQVLHREKREQQLRKDKEWYDNCEADK